MDKGLKSESVSLLSGTSIAFNSCSPASTMAVTLGLLAPFAATKAPAMILVAFALMLTVTVPFMLLARYYPDCGQSFTWVTRAMSAYIGSAFGILSVLMTFIFFPIVVTVFVTYCYLLVGLESASTSSLWIVVGGLVTVAVSVYLAVREVKTGALVAVILMVFQVAAIVLLAIVVFARVGGSSKYISWSMLSPVGLSWSNLSGAILVALYLFMGWDIVTAFGEEAKGRLTTALSMLFSTTLLVAVLLLASTATTAYRGPGFLSENYADVLAAVAKDALGSPLDKVIILAVIASAFATFVNGIMSMARWNLSMATFQALPRPFARMGRTQVPVWGTVFWGVTTASFLVIENLISDNFLWDTQSGLFLLGSFYYLLPAVACPILLRKWIMRSATNFILMLVVPLLGAALMTVVVIKGFINYADPSYSYSPPVAGIPVPFLVAAGALGISIAYMVIWRFRRPEFYTTSVEELGMATADDAPSLESSPAMAG